jgi:hypothetical protein
MSTKIGPALDATTYCQSLLATMPRRYSGRQISWKDDPETTAKITAALLGCADVRSAIFHLYTATGIGVQTFGHFIYGNDSSGAAWPDLRAALSILGVSPLMTRVEARAQRVTDAATATPTVIERLATLTNDPPKAIAPVSDAPPVKPATLAVTNKGDVITATPPAAATMPSPMIATGGDFAVKASTTTAKACIDATTGDILVITTKRIPYGTPEHRARMIEMNTPKSKA